jgi:prephenate dehydratase
MTAKTRNLYAAFQGELGAFSQQAIVQLLGKQAKPFPCQRFDQVFSSLAAGQVQAAVVPIENTLHGSVHENYDHLLHYGFRILAETRVRIVHNLIAPPGVPFRKIRRVLSHPVALNQCLDFFATHPRIEKVPHYDTAGSVKTILEEGATDAAAIASELAAQIYGGTILKKGVEDDHRNFTRFFLLAPSQSKLRVPDDKSRPWKTSLVFSVRNVPGSLFRALATFALRDLSLTKIESRPLRGRPWEYLFYVDLLGHEEDEPVANALRHLAELTELLRVLGSYRAAEAAEAARER